MAINNKFIHFKTFANFQNELDAGNILDTSIVFIKDKLWIYTHGLYYYGNEVVLSEEYISSSLENESLEPVPGDILEEAISKLHKAILDNEEVITKTFLKMLEVIGLDDNMEYTPADSSLFTKTVVEAIDYLVDSKADKKETTLIEEKVSNNTEDLLDLTVSVVELEATTELITENLNLILPNVILSEYSNLQDGDLLMWDATTKKAVPMQYDIVDMEVTYEDNSTLTFKVLCKKETNESE